MEGAPQKAALAASGLAGQIKRKCVGARGRPAQALKYVHQQDYE
jgi:hypothetical protein